MNNDFSESFTSDNKNYKQWRKIHSEAFGDIFSSAFEDNSQAALCLTAALIRVSSRKFQEAMPLLLSLEDAASDDFDRAAINYFIGLNYEFMQSEEKMNEYYEQFASYGIKTLFNIAFLPYYRTAKFAQRDSECSKSLHYYFKALSFCRENAAEQDKMKLLSQLNYDIGTIYVYCHQYEKALRYLKESYTLDSSDNPQRSYVFAILTALSGNKAQLDTLLSSIPHTIRDLCAKQTSAILNGTDPHYCVVEQDGSRYPLFKEMFLKEKDELRKLVDKGDPEKAEAIMDRRLTDAFPFMQRTLSCRIEAVGSKITVSCKNYRVKTLVAEHKKLFEKINSLSSDWEFISVNEFLSY